MIVPLPVGEADPDRRLARIAAATASRKTLPPVLAPRRTIGHFGSYGRVASDVRLWPPVVVGSIVMVGGD